MRPEDLHDALNLLDDDLIEETGRLRSKRNPGLWVRWTSLAACLVLLVGIYTAGRFLLPPANAPEDTNDGEIHYENQIGDAGSSTTSPPNGNSQIIPAPPVDAPTDIGGNTPECPEEVLPDGMDSNTPQLHWTVCIQGSTATGYHVVICDSASPYYGQEAEIILTGNLTADSSFLFSIGDTVEVTVEKCETAAGSILLYVNAITPRT